MIPFSKYHGTGNDFILIDNRERKWSFSQEEIARMCHRRFGIGADGLMLLQLKEGYDFEMVYYNSDGRRSSMCGNGGRCIAAFAEYIGLIQKEARFIAYDGPHTALLKADQVSLSMNDVHSIEYLSDTVTVMNTGSPHYVQYTEGVQQYDVVKEGRRIRNQDLFRKEGINVNFIEWKEDVLWVRTYERGVEDETLSCGTGVTASAIASTKSQTGKFDLGIRTPGGSLRVLFTKTTPMSATDIWLEGPAVLVYNGTWPKA